MILGLPRLCLKRRRWRTSLFTGSSLYSSSVLLFKCWNRVCADTHTHTHSFILLFSKAKPNSDVLVPCMSHYHYSGGSVGQMKGRTLWNGINIYTHYSSLLSRILSFSFTLNIGTVLEIFFSRIFFRWLPPRYLHVLFPGLLSAAIHRRPFGFFRPWSSERDSTDIESKLASGEQRRRSAAARVSLTVPPAAVFVLKNCARDFFFFFFRGDMDGVDCVRVVSSADWPSPWWTWPWWPGRTDRGSRPGCSTAGGRTASTWRLRMKWRSANMAADTLPPCSFVRLSSVCLRKRRRSTFRRRKLVPEQTRCLKTTKLLPGWSPSNKQSYSRLCDNFNSNESVWTAFKTQA